MSDYESIRGTRVKYLTSDPTLNSSTEGQVWYNSTEGALKSLVQIKAWSSSGNMGTARYLIGSCGSQTAALGFGGYSGTYKDNTEEYNGFNWSTGGSLNLARFNPGGAGSQTAALAFGGFIAGPPTSPTNATEEYDGSSWTAQNTMPTAVRNPAGSGTQTAGLSSGGNAGPPGVTGVTQEYDGTNWTTSPGSMNVARENATGFGLQTATIVAGGNEPGVNNAEQYDGSTWTAVSNLNSPVYSLASAANGTTSHGITFGGASPAGTGLTQTEEWDGTSWTISSATLAAGKWKLGGAGTASAGLKFAGGPPPAGQTGTEEYNSNINAITQAVWASGGNLTTGRMYLAGCGATQNTGLAFGGAITPFPSTAKNETEEYNGSSWSEQNNLVTARKYLAGCGTQTAGLAFGGADPALTGATEEYDGSSWTSGGALSTARNNLKGCGTQTAGLAFGGSTSTLLSNNVTEEYDGSSWTVGGALNTSVYQGGGAGTQTAGLAFGGNTPTKKQTEEYNGTAWTTVPGTLNTGLTAMGTAGIQTAAISMLGREGGDNSVLTEEYDGTNWTVSANAATARRGLAGGGTQSSALAFGGFTSTEVNNTEEYTGGTEVVTASTLTTS